MIEISRIDLAWATGFFDGEGCTVLQKRPGNSTSVYLSIDQRDHRVIDRFYLSVDRLGSVYCLEHKTGGVVYRYRTTTFENSQQVIAMLWPWLSVVKKEQYTRVARQYLDSRKKTRPISKPNKASKRKVD